MQVDSTTIVVPSWMPVIVALIAAIATIGVPIINALLVNRNAKAAAMAAAEVARILSETSSTTDKKLDELRKLSDGHLTALTKEIKRLQELRYKEKGDEPKDKSDPKDDPGEEEHGQ